jgi:hypothetical protein
VVEVVQKHQIRQPISASVQSFCASINVRVRYYEKIKREQRPFRVGQQSEIHPQSCHPQWLHVICDGYRAIAHIPASDGGASTSGLDHGDGIWLFLSCIGLIGLDQRMIKIKSNQNVPASSHVIRNGYMSSVMATLL